MLLIDLAAKELKFWDHSMLRSALNQQ